MNQNELFKNLRHQLMTYAFSLGCQKENASDIVHDVLLKAFQKGFLETEEKIQLPYMKKMVKNHFIDQKRSRLTLFGCTEILRIADDLPAEQEEKDIHYKIEGFLENHRYGYIIFEMERRNIKHVKDLAPYTNEKANKLYNRYQKLVKDLKVYLKKGRVGGKTFKLPSLDDFERNLPILERIIVMRL